MPFSLGSVEFIALVAMAIAVGLLYMCRHRHYRVGVAATICAALAAFLTPADLLSMMVMFVAFFGVFVFGTCFRIGSPSTTA